MLIAEAARSLWILAEDVPGSTGDGTTIALYGMFSAIAVAFITGLFAYLVSRSGKKEKGSEATGQFEAWERWFMLHDVDVRRIKTGFESWDEVRRAPDLP